METRKVSYYKLTKNISFNDGFSLDKGTVVQFNFSEGQIYNVQNCDKNQRRNFWVHISDVELLKTVKEKWSKKEIERNNLDLNEKWLEYERQIKQKSSNNRDTNIAVKKSNSPRDKSSKKISTKNSTGRTPIKGKKTAQKSTTTSKKRKKVKGIKKSQRI